MIARVGPEECPSYTEGLSPSVRNPLSPRSCEKFDVQSPWQASTSLFLDDSSPNLKAGIVQALKPEPSKGLLDRGDKYSCGTVCHTYVHMDSLSAMVVPLLSQIVGTETCRPSPGLPRAWTQVRAQAYHLVLATSLICGYEGARTQERVAYHVRYIDLVFSAGDKSKVRPTVSGGLDCALTTSAVNSLLALQRGMDKGCERRLVAPSAIRKPSALRFEFGGGPRKPCNLKKPTMTAKMVAVSRWRIMKRPPATTKACKDD
eukprot:scaffold112_cov282-Prasinococcus_capsulatus_cf.AAC.10